MMFCEFFHKFQHNELCMVLWVRMLAVVVLVGLEYLNTIFWLRELQRDSCDRWHLISSCYSFINIHIFNRFNSQVKVIYSRTFPMGSSVELTVHCCLFRETDVNCCWSKSSFPCVDCSWIERAFALLFAYARVACSLSRMPSRTWTLWIVNLVSDSEQRLGFGE